MKFSLLSMLIFLILVQAACSLPFAAATEVATLTPTANPELAGLAGKYACMGNEYGLIAGYGEFTLTKEGKLIEGGKEFSLKPAATSHVYTIIDHPQLDRMEVKQADMFYLYIKAGLKVGHADGGVVWCEKEK